MAIYELPTKEEYGPYKASIGTDGYFSSGHIRIEPPFYPGEELIKWGEADDITYGHFVSTDSSTIISYSIQRLDRDSNLRDLTDSLDSILEHLGHAASAVMFEEYWDKFNHKENHGE